MKGGELVVTAKIHLTNGEVVTVNNLKEVTAVLRNKNHIWDISKENKNDPIAIYKDCAHTFIGDKITVAFSAGEIIYFEILKDE